MGIRRTAKGETEMKKCKGLREVSGWVEEERQSLVCKECGKECKSKGGLTIHQKRMHRQETLSEEKKEQMKCKYREKMFRRVANRMNHETVCQRKPEGESVGGKKCRSRWKEREECGHVLSAATNMARHKTQKH